MFDLNALLSVQAGELLRKPELKSTPAAAAVVTPMRIKLLAPSSPGDVDSSPEARALIPAHPTHPAPLKLLPPATHHARFANHAECAAALEQQRDDCELFFCNCCWRRCNWSVTEQTPRRRRASAHGNRSPARNQGVLVHSSLFLAAILSVAFAITAPAVEAANAVTSSRSAGSAHKQRWRQQSVA